MPSKKKRIRLTFEVTQDTYDYVQTLQPGIRGKFLKAVLEDVIRAVQSSKTPYKLVAGLLTHAIALEDLIGDLDEVYNPKQEYQRDDESGVDDYPEPPQE